MYAYVGEETLETAMLKHEQDDDCLSYNIHHILIIITD